MRCVVAMTRAVLAKLALAALPTWTSETTPRIAIAQTSARTTGRALEIWGCGDTGNRLLSFGPPNVFYRIDQSKVDKRFLESLGGLWGCCDYLLPGRLERRSTSCASKLAGDER